MRRGWTIAGLAIALFAIPLIVALFNLLRIPWTAQSVVLRELALFAFAGVLVLIIRRKERLGWESVGLGRPAIGSTAVGILIAIVAVALALAASFGLIRLLGLPVGSVDAPSYDALPAWVMLLVVVRAGILEELFYRGYAIERLLSLGGSRALAVLLPLLLFGAFHYRQGFAGILIALLTGAALTWAYMVRRNLWVTIATHFLVDFIPNILVPLFERH